MYQISFTKIKFKGRYNLRGKFNMSLINAVTRIKNLNLSFKNL